MGAEGQEMIEYVMIMQLLGASPEPLVDRSSFNDHDLRQIECLADNIYHEARGESIIGQIAVAQVTLNRVEHSYFPDTVCDVVWQPHQFSWTGDGRSDETHDRARYEVAVNIAETVYVEVEDDPTDGALFYHATYISPPSWTRQMEEVTNIGVHVFYHWDGNWN